VQDLLLGKPLKFGILGGSISWGEGVARGREDWFSTFTLAVQQMVGGGGEGGGEAERRPRLMGAGGARVSPPPGRSCFAAEVLAAAWANGCQLDTEPLPPPALQLPAANVTGRNGCIPGTPSSYMNMCLDLSLDEDVDLVSVAACLWAVGLPFWHTTSARPALSKAPDGGACAVGGGWRQAAAAVICWPRLPAQVFVEYALNDGSSGSLGASNNAPIYERLLRKIISKANKPAVVLMQVRRQAAARRCPAAPRAAAPVPLHCTPAHSARSCVTPQSDTLPPLNATSLPSSPCQHSAPPWEHHHPPPAASLPPPLPPQTPTHHIHTAAPAGAVPRHGLPAGAQ
jgi:hypothetical protein